SAAVSDRGFLNRALARTQGERYDEPGTAPSLVVRLVPNLATERLDVALDEVQAEPDALTSPGHLAARPIEPLEDPPCLLGGHSDALISDRQAGTASALLEGNVHALG